MRTTANSASNGRRSDLTRKAAGDMSDMGFVYKRDEQLMNARRMVSRAQEAMVSWDFRAVNEQINLLAKQLRFMQTHETAEALADIATSKAD